jgi:energy-coupling factor transporter ATP-binding protein EcfA2
MTVAANVGYGLMVRRTAWAAIARRVREVVDVVGPSAFADRYPAELSGGQRQRTALARAIVLEPKLVLLDEPLGALDARLRRQMQGFLKALQRRIGTAFLFVTHDQEEAITIAGRIVVRDAPRAPSSRWARCRRSTGGRALPSWRASSATIAWSRPRRGRHARGAGRGGRPSHHRLDLGLLARVPGLPERPLRVDLTSRAEGEFLAPGSPVRVAFPLHAAALAPA